MTPETQSVGSQRNSGQMSTCGACQHAKAHAGHQALSVPVATFCSSHSTPILNLSAIDFPSLLLASDSYKTQSFCPHTLLARSWFSWSVCLSLSSLPFLLPPIPLPLAWFSLLAMFHLLFSLPALGFFQMPLAVLLLIPTMKASSNIP